MPRIKSTEKTKFFTRIESIAKEMHGYGNEKIKEIGNTISKMLLNKNGNFLNEPERSQIIDAASRTKKFISKLLANIPDKEHADYFEKLLHTAIDTATSSIPDPASAATIFSQSGAKKTPEKYRNTEK